MKCTVCQRELAPDLSMCFRCGAMRNDSVREELEQSLTTLSGSLKPRNIEEPEPFMRTTEPALPETVPTSPEVAAPVPPPVVRRVATSDLAIKKTSPTLAEFVTKNATLPDWRLQLQNSIRQRNGRLNAQARTADAVSSQAGQATPAQTNGANALKVGYVAQNAEPINEKDRAIANALQRIEQSRRKFLPSEKAREGMRVAKEASKKFPYAVVARSDELPNLPARTGDETAAAPRPKLISSLKIERKKYDTNKLVPIPEAAEMAAAEPAEIVEVPHRISAPLKKSWSQRIEIREPDAKPERAGRIELIDEPVTEDAALDVDDLDDLAPISMRFNAGLFDMIIGGFAAFALLLPFLATSEGWFSLSGITLFVSVLLVVMFVYLTASLAFLGQTFGMKLFALELVDIEVSEFPSLHQAAVSSSVYLLSLLLAGLGFVPMLFNEERRAAHDIASGTILVRAL